MCTSQVASSLLITGVLGMVLAGGHLAGAQDVHVEVGGGWAIPSSSVRMTGPVKRGGETIGPGARSMDLSSGPNLYAAVGLVWTVSSNFALKGRVRAQQSGLRGNRGELGCEGCTVIGNPDGKLRGVTVEGQIVLTSTGRIEPYFLVGLGVVHTTVDGARVEIPGDEETEGAVVEFSDVAVTDAGGDVGFGAIMEVVGSLSLTAEIRAAGSLPGAKENAVTTFPFSLGLSYRF